MKEVDNHTPVCGQLGSLHMRTYEIQGMVSRALLEPQVSLTAQIYMVFIFDLKSQKQLIRPHCFLMDLLDSTTYRAPSNISTYQQKL